MVKSLNGLFGKKNTGVGIELSPQRVNIARLRKQRQGLKIETLTSIPVPEGVYVDGQIADPPAMAQIIQQGLAESKLKVTRVATAVTGRDSIVRLIPVPAELDEKELREMVLIPIHEKPDTNKASRIKSQPVMEATIDVFNCANRFQINSLNSSKLGKLSQVKCLLTSSHNLSMGLT